MSEKERKRERETSESGANLSCFSSEKCKAIICPLAKCEKKKAKAKIRGTRERKKICRGYNYSPTQATLGLPVKPGGH